MSSESNALASQNGCRMEDLIKTLYPGATFDYLGLVDLTINGVRVEIKSCQDKIKDSNNSGGTRSGRFCFKDLQHKELVENAGEYIFLVQREGIPFLYFRVPARCIDPGEFSGVKSVCWKTIIQGGIC
jgi:hypothetical protein